MTDRDTRLAAVVPRLEDPRAVVAEASRAPSVHNVQPARWRFEPNGRVVLFRAVDRSLPVGDPSGHDLRLSLGAHWEGLTLALSRRGIALTSPEASEGPAPPGCAPVARAWLRGSEAGADPLSEWVEARRSYRGVFAPTASDVVRRLDEMRGPDLVITTRPGALREYAALYDRANFSFMARDDYEQELYRWLRLSRSHPDWGRDGLNADCLALSGLERVFAQVALRPPMFRALKRLGVARYLITESEQIRSAAALVLFAPDRSLDDFDVGRRFYRLWLDFTRLGLSLAPMSALSDHPESAATLCRLNEIDPNRRLANVFRVGTAPAGVARSPRLPSDDLIV